jgi:uncharacterized repeat protein (TIGR01451 family)
VRQSLYPAGIALTLGLGLSAVLMLGISTVQAAPPEPYIVRDINATTEASDPSNLVNVNGVLFFSADDGDNGEELWRSDGTAAGTFMVANVNPLTTCDDTGAYPGYGSDPCNSSPSHLVNVNGILFFSADDGVSGKELWRSNGTVTGTFLVTDINPLTTCDLSGGNPGSGSYPCNSSIYYPVNVNGTLFFSADDGDLGQELWKSDGTPTGTIRVRDIYAGSNSSSLSYLSNVNGALFFCADDGNLGRELWKSDGTPTGTTLVKDINPGSGHSDAYGMTAVDGTFFFSANDGSSGHELWKSDGTPTGTTLVKDIRSGAAWSTPQYLTNMNGTLLFKAYGSDGRELWRSDGTPTGTVQVKDIYPGLNPSNPDDLTIVNGTLFFSANDGTTSGEELWKSDGTLTGTVMVKDINPAEGSYPYYLAGANDTLFFIADDGINGYELWKSDGTPTGTVLVRDIYAGANDAEPYDLTDVNGTLFFNATDGSSGRELWTSDGTPMGTILVEDINAHAENSHSDLSDLIVVDGIILFSADDGGSEPVLQTNSLRIASTASEYTAGCCGTELWRSDGTLTGTTIVTDIDPGRGSSNPEELTNLNGTIFFSADDGSSGDELWRSDGTPTGTVRVKDVYTGTGGSYPSDFINMDGTLFFSARDVIAGGELWKSDGTPTGTVMIANINPLTTCNEWGGSPGSGSYPCASSPNDLTDVDGTLFFVANDGSSGPELWKSDGTPTGTVRIKDIYTGATGSAPSYLTNVNGTLFFSADDGSSGRELWKSDGTPTGTFQVKDIYSGSFRSQPRYLTHVNGTLFFAATDDSNGYELWRSDGTPTDTVMVKDIYPGSDGSSPYCLTVVNGTLFFRASDDSGGTELWKSDGTPTGTVRVKDIVPGSDGSYPADLTDINGLLFFSTWDGVTGTGLWRSDGTSTGTVRVTDMDVGEGGEGAPAWLTYLNDTLFFNADDGSRGQELWAVSLQPNPAIVKTVVPTTPVAPGDPITYTLTFSNAGHLNTATGVVITDVVPVSVTNVVSISNGAIITPLGSTRYAWLVEDLGPSQRGVITITGILSADLPTCAFTNTTVIASAGVDVNPTDNGSSAMVTVEAPSLRVIKTVEGAGGGTLDLPLSGVVTYTVVLSNSGAGVARGVVMTDALPPGVSFRGWIITGSVHLPLSDNTIAWGPHDVPAGTSYPIRFTANITDADTFGGRTIVNTAHFASTNAGSGSDDASFTIRVGFSIYLPLVLRNY